MRRRRSADTAGEHEPAAVWVDRRRVIPVLAHKEPHRLAAAIGRHLVHITRSAPGEQNSTPVGCPDRRHDPDVVGQPLLAPAYRVEHPESRPIAVVNHHRHPGTVRGHTWIDIPPRRDRQRLLVPVGADPHQPSHQKVRPSTRHVDERPTRRDLEIRRAAALCDHPVEDLRPVAADLEAVRVEAYRTQRALDRVQEMPGQNVAGVAAPEIQRRRRGASRRNHGELVVSIGGHDRDEYAAPRKHLGPPVVNARFRCRQPDRFAATGGHPPQSP